VNESVTELSMREVHSVGWKKPFLINICGYYKIKKMKLLVQNFFFSFFIFHNKNNTELSKSFGPTLGPILSIYTVFKQEFHVSSPRNNDWILWCTQKWNVTWLNPNYPFINTRKVDPPSSIKRPIDNYIQVLAFCKS
jgi:hypothetical protein